MKNSHRLIGILAIGLGILVLAAAGVWFALQHAKQSGEGDSFSSCVSAGNPVMESYPRQCRGSDGKLYEDPEERAHMNAQQAAIEQAKMYDQGDKICTQALVPAKHAETGAYYTFPSGCLAPGWVPVTSVDE